MLNDCIGKLGKQLSSIDREDIESSYKQHLKTKSEYDAAISALTEYHKSLFDQTNEFRSQVGLKPVDYVAAQVPAPEKGFDITAQTGPTPTTAIGKVVEQRNAARREADTDVLTGLPNNVAFEKAKARLEADPEIELTSVDLNNFKAINDKNGHPVGDQALKDAGQDLLSAAKKSSPQAQVFRPHGDEFIIASPRGAGTDIVKNADGVFSQRKYGEVSGSLAGSSGNTYAEAEKGLPDAKAARKALQSANAQENPERTSARNNPPEPRPVEQGTSGRIEETGGQAPVETKPPDTGPAKGQPKPLKGVRSLSEFVRKMGGIKSTKWDTGEHRRISNKETGTTGLINNKSGITAERMAEIAWESGYLHDEWPEHSDINGNEFMSFIEDDYTNFKKHYSREDEEQRFNDDFYRQQEEEYFKKQESDPRAREEYAQRQDELLGKQTAFLNNPEAQKLLAKVDKEAQYDSEGNATIPNSETRREYYDKLDQFGLEPYIHDAAVLEAHREARKEPQPETAQNLNEVQPQRDNEQAKTEVAQPSYGSKNKLVTQDRAQKARDILTKRLGGSNTQFNSGIDPEILKAGAELAAYHVEAGARKFADFSKRMIEDVGEQVRPYLRELYQNVWTQHQFKGMDEPTPEQIIVTGIKKSIDDAEREAMGFRDAPTVEPHKLQQANTEAAQIIAKDPFAGQKLVRELNEKPRGLSDTETAVLVHYKRTIDNEYNAAVEGINEGHDDNNEQQIAENRARIAAISDERQALMDAGRRSGTEKGRALNAQKILMKEDFSLASLEAQKRAANGGRPLTDDERSELQNIADEYKAKSDALENHLNEKELELAGLKEKMPNSRIIEVAEGIVKKLDARADAARDRLKKRGFTFTSGLDPLAVKDLAEIGASHIAKVGLDFIKFSDAMVKEFGEKIKPHLQNIYDASNKLVEGIEPNARERILTPKTPEEIAKKIGEKIDEGDDSVSGLIQRLAKMFVSKGVKNRDELITKIHELVKDSIPERRDVMDAVSGYGKYKQLSKNEVDVTLRDLKGQMQQIAKIEDMAGGQAPSKTGLERRTPSDTERQLIKQVEETKRQGGYNVTDPATQLKTALQAAKTRLQNQIVDLETQIARQARFVKNKSSLQYDNEANTLKTRRDELKKQFNEVFGTELSDAARLRAWKNRTQKRISDLNQKIMTGDYSKAAPKNPIQLDAEAQKMRIELDRVKHQFERDLRQDRLKNRPIAEKVLDGWAKYVRAGMLSWPTTLGKLTNAAAGRIILSPVEEGIKKGVTKIPGFQKGQAAPTSSIKIEATALTKGIIEGSKDAWMMLKNKDSNLDVLLGKEKYDHTPLEYFGQVHGALKAPVKRIAYERSLQKQIELGMRSGIDVTDPLVQMQMSLKAYEDANREIFMQDSRTVNFVRRGLTALEAKDKEGKVNLAGKVGATAIRTLFPIMKIPVNYAGEVMQYTVGSVTGVAKLGLAFRKGMENVSASEKEAITRHLAKGSLGLAAVSLGFYNPAMFGGYYTGKRDEKDVKAGGIRIGGIDLPRWATHIPIIEVAQIGATIRRVMDSKLRKSDKDTQGLSAGVMAGGVGLAEEVPFVKETVNMSKLMDQRERNNFMGEFAKSRLVPGLMQWAASKSDTKDGFFSDAIKRKPESLWEHIETGIPGLRQNVQSKGEAMDIKTATTDQMVDAIQDIRSQKKDSAGYEKKLVQKALNARKAGSLTREEVGRIQEVLPNFKMSPRVRRANRH